MKPKLFCGRANPEFGQAVADYLGVELGKRTIKPFSDGELWVRFDENVAVRMFLFFRAQIHQLQI